MLGADLRNIATPMLAARARDRAWAEKGADLRAKLRGINIMRGKGDSSQ